MGLEKEARVVLRLSFTPTETTTCFSEDDAEVGVVVAAAPALAQRIWFLLSYYEAVQRKLKDDACEVNGASFSSLSQSCNPQTQRVWCPKLRSKISTLGETTGSGLSVFSFTKTKKP